MMRARLTIAGMMGVVLLVGAAFAGLTHPTMLWSRAVATLTAVVLLTAILGALFGRGHARGFWAGYALFGWFFLMISVTTWSQNEFVHQAGFSDMDQLLFGWFYPSTPTSGTVTDEQLNKLIQMFSSFRIIVHAFVSHVAGLIGGGIGYAFARHNEPGQSEN